LSLSSQKCGFGIRKKPIPDTGSRGQKAPDPGSATLPKTCGYLTAGPFDAHLLLAGLGADGDDPAAQAQRQVLTVIRPGTAVDPSRNLRRIHFFKKYTGAKIKNFPEVFFI
jgi:hypothetical protein